jgi:hypothetical protein
MPHQPAEVRRHNFEEVALGLDLDGALHEADRCIRCKKPRCVPGCPVGIDIPGFIAALQHRDIKTSYQILKSSNALPAVAGGLPAGVQCEATCVVGAKFAGGDRPAGRTTPTRDGPRVGGDANRRRPEEGRDHRVGTRAACAGAWRERRRSRSSRRCTAAGCWYDLNSGCRT